MAALTRSMTGFGSATCEREGLRVSSEVRSVNHRYLKIVTRLPEELAWAQGLVEEHVRSALSRGYVTASISLSGSAPRGAVEIDHEQLEGVAKELLTLRERIGVDGTIDLANLLLVPGIVRVLEADGAPSEELEPLVIESLKEALDGLDAMQLREGEILNRELNGLLDRVAAGLTEVEKHQSEIGENNRNRYLARIREFLDGTGVELEHSDLIREVAILAEKADIAEEIGRLRGHVTQFREVLGSGGRVGRKLDFLTQEMFREANTMAAKVAVYEMSRVVVEIKADVDRLREQTQNVE